MAKKKPQEPRVRVAPDCRDASRDFFIPKTIAKEMLESGKLGQDLTNQCLFPVTTTALLEAKVHSVKE